MEKYLVLFRAGKKKSDDNLIFFYIISCCCLFYIACNEFPLKGTEKSTATIIINTQHSIPTHV